MGMNRLLGISAVVISASALTVALVTGISSTPPPPAVLPADIDELMERVQLLEENNAQLRARIEVLSQRPQPVAGQPTPATAEVERLRNEVRELLTNNVASDEGKSMLKELVRDVQEDVSREQREARAERAKQMQTRMTARRQERWQKFITDSRLSFSQEQTLKQRLEAEDTMRTSMFNDLRDGKVDGTDVRRALTKAREETDALMKQQLSEEQRKAYEAMRGEEGGRGARRNRAGAEEGTEKNTPP